MRTRIATLTVLGGLALAGVAAYQARARLISRVLQLPLPQHSVGVEHCLRIPMPDGVQLTADHFFPLDRATGPTVLIRTPYGIPSDSWLLGGAYALISRAFAAQGHHVLIQSTRGRFASEGDFDPFVHEAEDGRATIRWLAQQPWCNGTIAMWGASYLGYTQWTLAADASPSLRAIVPVITSTRFSRLLFPEGVFALETALRWIDVLKSMDDLAAGDTCSIAEWTNTARTDTLIAHAARTLPVSAADRLVAGHSVPYFQTWLDNEELASPYWQHVDVNHALGKVEAAVHLVAGWYDMFLRDQLTDYAALLSAGRRPYLTIGPQHHVDAGIQLEGLRQGLAWFAAHLKGDEEQLRRPPVRLYLMGADEWHEMGYWPPPASITRYYLHSGRYLGLTAATVSEASSTYIYDPLDPTPSIGGPVLSPQGGPRDQRPLEQRGDVLLFSTEPLADDIDVIGHVRLELFVRSDQAYTDFIGRLCDVYPNGRSVNVCEGLFRVAPGRGELQPDGSLRIAVDMWATAQRFKRGHRIRLHVCSAAHPRWNRNLNSGQAIAEADQARRARQTLYHDAAHPAALVLPIVARPV
jgi:hypothetical protein